MSEIGKPNCKAEPHLFASEAWAVRRFLLHFEPSGMKEQWGALVVPQLSRRTGASSGAHFWLAEVRCCTQCHAWPCDPRVWIPKLRCWQ